MSFFFIPYKKRALYLSADLCANDVSPYFVIFENLLKKVPQRIVSKYQNSTKAFMMEDLFDVTSTHSGNVPNIN